MTTPPATDYKYIELRPTRSGEVKPFIAGTRISVELIYVLRELRGMTPDEIVAGYPHLTLGQVHAALAYFYDHPREIREAFKRSEEFVEQMKQKTGPGPLQSKLTKPGTHGDSDSVSS